MKSELVPLNGDPPIPITRDVTVVGSRAGCDVVLKHKGLSKRHCAIVRTVGLLVVRDLASTNGTKVNGQRVRWAALLPNDRVEFAGYKIRVYLGPDTAPAPSERHPAVPRGAKRVRRPSTVKGPAAPRPAPPSDAALDPIRDAAERAWRGSDRPSADDGPLRIDLD